MKYIVGYLKSYIHETNKTVFILSALFTSVLIFLNYYFNLSRIFYKQAEPVQFLSWFFVCFLAFATPYFIYSIILKQTYFKHKKFVLLLLLAPAIFAWKMSADIHFNITNSKLLNDYWNIVLYYPVKLLVVLTALFFIWKTFDNRQPFYGVSTRLLKIKPYLYMLLIMIPLIAWASTQPDFLQVYPKLKHVNMLQGQNKGWYKLLYELSYGVDFLSIEIFFRGFLILAFIKWAGTNAILPMAIFYCTIHFGKPLGECISSFFGGIVLGVVTYHTRTIWGGLMVHLGIAWLMELGGYLGSIYVLHA